MRHHGHVQTREGVERPRRSGIRLSRVDCILPGTVSGNPAVLAKSSKSALLKRPAPSTLSKQRPSCDMPNSKGLNARPAPASDANLNSARSLIGIS